MFLSDFVQTWFIHSHGEDAMSVLLSPNSYLTQRINSKLFPNAMHKDTQSWMMMIDWTVKYSRSGTAQILIADNAQMEGLDTSESRERENGNQNLLDLIYPL